MDLRRGKVDVVAGQRQVAGDEETETARHNMSARQRHGWLRTLMEIEQELAEIAAPEVTPFRQRGFQIRAGAEDLIALPRQSNDPDVRPLRRLPQRTP